MPKIGSMQTRSKYYVATLPWSIWEAVIDHAAEAQEDNPTAWVERMLVAAAKKPSMSWKRDKPYVPARARRGSNKRIRLGPEAKAALKMGVRELGGSVTHAIQVLYFTGLQDYAFKRLREHVASYAPKS